MSASGTARVLFVDDNEMMAKTLRDITRLNGFEAEAAYSIEEAMALIRSHPFDCILSDIRMPEATGLSLFHDLHNENIKPLFVLMTAHVENAFKEKSLAAGVLDIIDKPIAIDTLLTFLAAIKRPYNFLIKVTNAKTQQTLQAWLIKHHFNVIKNEQEPTKTNTIILQESEEAEWHNGAKATIDTISDNIPTIFITDKAVPTASKRFNGSHVTIQKPLSIDIFTNTLHTIHCYKLRQILATGL